MKMRSLKFWGRLCAQSLGVTFGGAAVWFLFMSVGSSDCPGNIGEAIGYLLPLYSYFLLLAGAMVVLIYGITYFQVYFPVVLSLGATRKSIITGIAGCMLGVTAGILAGAGMIWRLVPGEISSAGWSMMPLFAGGFLIMSAFGMFMGTVVRKWGKVGVIMTAVLFMLIGGGAGMSVALFNKDGIVDLLVSFKDAAFQLPLAIGILLYLAAVLFAFLSARKMEV